VGGIRRPSCFGERAEAAGRVCAATASARVVGQVRGQHAAADDGFQERQLAGSGKEEEQSIMEMRSARQRNGKELEKLKDKLPELAK